MIRRTFPSPLAALLVGAVGLTGCGLASFDVSQDIPPQTIPGSPVGALLPDTLFSIPLNIDLKSTTAGHGTGPATSVKLSSITLTITSPSGGTFAFVDSISFTISARGAPDEEFARLQPVPATTTITIPPIRDVDLLDYINSGATITATVSGRAPAADTTFDGKVVVTVRV
jgi:hypothetical protein